MQRHALFAAFAMVLLHSTAWGALTDLQKCRAAIVKASDTFVGKRVAALQQCEGKVAKGKLPSGTDCTEESKTRAATQKAADKLRNAIDKACGGEDDLCGGDTSDEQGGAILGFAACPIVGGGCGGAIGVPNCVGVASCLQCLGEHAADQAIDLYAEPLHTGGAVEKALRKCQSAIASAGTKYLGATSKALAKCWTAVAKNKATAPCPVPGDGKAASALADAASKLSAAILKACAGKDKQVGGSGENADFTPLDIGFPPTCSNLGPAGGACGGAVANLTDLIACVGCVSGFGAECTSRFSAPFGGASPPECGTLPATPTPTATPVLTGGEPTPTPTCDALVMTSHPRFKLLGQLIVRLFRARFGKIPRFGTLRKTYPPRPRSLLSRAGRAADGPEIVSAPTLARPGGANTLTLSFAPGSAATNGALPAAAPYSILVAVQTDACTTIPEYYELELDPDEQRAVETTVDFDIEFAEDLDPEPFQVLVATSSAPSDDPTAIISDYTALTQTPDGGVLRRIADINPGPVSSFIYSMGALNDILYFQAGTVLPTSQNVNVALWRTDGTAEGTVLVKSVTPDNIENIGGTLYFTGAEGEHGSEPWKSDGTTEGTVIIKDINPNGSSTPISRKDIGGTILFDADDGTHGRELWSTDGTEGNTSLVKDIQPLGGGSQPQGFRRLGNVLYFSADDGAHGRELWRSDGTTDGTSLVRDLRDGPAGGVPGFTTTLGTLMKEFDDRLVFQANDGDTGFELWASDGTEAGTVRVKDINQGIGDSSPAGFTRLGDVLIFSAEEPEHGREIWRTDGTENGTVLIQDMIPGHVGSAPLNGNPTEFTAFNGAVYFSASGIVGNTSFRGLWRTDGTPEGTVLVSGVPSFVFPAVGLGSAQSLVVAGGKLFFTGRDDIRGTELWETDGTTAGTKRVRDILRGEGNGVSIKFVCYAGEPCRPLAGLTSKTLFFPSDDGESGTELWGVDY